jgi:A/G-specific adenine glycosylase
MAKDCSRMLADWCSQRGHALDNSEALPSFLHDFSHYRLQVQPWRLQLAQRKPAQMAEIDRQLWVADGDLAGLGLPSPIQRLLSSAG